VTAGRAGRVAVIAIAALALVGLAAVLAGPAMGLFSGSPPAHLGFRDGRFAAGDWRPNWVSSTVARTDATHHVAPIAFAGDAAAAWAALQSAIAAMPGARIVTREAAYLHAEFASRRLRFVDDAEFALDAPARVIHVKSAARLGVRDFGVNRARVEALRAALARGPGKG
jgi:uncharacterized protein (DUF1499 family)